MISKSINVLIILSIAFSLWIMVNHFEFVFSMYMVENMASWLMKLTIEKICYTWQWLLVFELWSIVLNFFFLDTLLKNLASWLMNLNTERMGFTFWLFLIYIVLLKLPVPMVPCTLIFVYKDWTSRILMMNLCYDV